MLATDKYFEAFAKAGMLHELAWSPRNGDAPQTVQVRFRAPTRDVLGGEFAGTDYSIEYPAAQLAGLKRGETVTVNGGTYTVRENPRSELDGTRMQAFLTRA